MTKLEIIEETVKFYSKDIRRRSLDTDGVCVYNGIHNTHCAVGRALLPKYKKEISGNRGYGVKRLPKQNGEKSLDDMLSEKYRGHEEEFWRDLQALHDTDHYWKSGGLTEYGENWVGELKERYNTIEL